MPIINMELPESSATPYKQRFFALRNKRSALRKWSLRGAAATLAVLVGFGAFWYIQLHKAFGDKATAAALRTNVDPSLLKGEGDGRVNILLMGRGGDGHDAPDLTDTIMLASIDPVNKKAALLSVPRDLWVNIPNEGDMKLNAAYEVGKYNYLGHISSSNSNRRAVDAGLALADQTIEKVLGIPIHYNMLVDFQAFKQAVNTVGGVKVDVPEQLYDPTMAWENGWNPVLAKPGSQIFNGKKALIYVRSRETSSDFARGERQRLVITALKNRVVTAGTLSNPLKISQLTSAFGNNVRTDLSVSDTMRLMDLLKSIVDSKVKSIGLSDDATSYVTTGNIGGQSVVLPKAGLFDYSAIQKFVRSQLPDGFIVKEGARVTVLNGTNQPGVATHEAEVLKSYGYKVGKVANASATYPENILVDLTHGRKKYTKNYLEKRFGVKAVRKLPSQVARPDRADFVIIIGNK